MSNEAFDKPVKVAVHDKSQIPLRKALIGFFSAWLVFAAVLYLMPLPPGMSPAAKKVLAVLLWAVIIWVTEAMPVGAAGLLIPALLVISGAQPKLPQALSGFSQGVSILALVAFLFAAFMQLSGLDRRIALIMVQKFKATTVGRMVWSLFATNFVLAFMIPGSVARQGTLLPVVNGLVRLFGDTPEERAAKKTLVIHALTYACLICGIVIQTAHMPNLIMTGLFAKELSIHISFINWFLLQFPILMMFVFTYLWTGWYFKAQGLKVPGGLEMVSRQQAAMGKASREELIILTLFVLVALAWATESIHKISTPVVGLLFIALFFIPGLLPYKWGLIQEKTIWGTWLMLAGAMSLSAAVSASGLATYLANLARPLAEGHHWVVILIIMIIATHIIRLGMLSNVAAISMLAPVMLAMAPMFNLNPIPFTLIVCNTDTFAYLLPTQTTAGVIAYSTGTFTFADYAKVGIGAMIIAAFWDIVFMSQWYAFMGFPIWQPLTP
ncbi:MAG: DASS family sodium-coupled anion symporter [Deltaproteobacteria bacterium]|nr:DASS family sodium-coupled anion symporter [Deltaproteobacteria bacterium]MBI4794953.1 DASS family sodium-coupled anion symporter [Deltaproteobacteria bacterium]